MGETWMPLFRQNCMATAAALIDVPYFEDESHPSNGKWLNISVPPKQLDCSGLTEGIYHAASVRSNVVVRLPHGSNSQFNFCKPTAAPGAGDLAFFGRGKDARMIYHVGMVFDDQRMIEARAPDAGCSFPTGKVIFRPRKNWEASPNFMGYFTHPMLIGDANAR